MHIVERNMAMYSTVVECEEYELIEHHLVSCVPDINFYGTEHYSVIFNGLLGWYRFQTVKTLEDTSRR